jgi:hypothetical protein
VQIKTQRSLADQINDVHFMPDERESRPPHTPATEKVHYNKEFKELASSGQPSPAPITGFASKSYDGYYPPDPHGAVSSNYVVGTVNDELYIQDRSGNLIIDIALKNFWAPVHQTIRLFDPRLVYDPNMQRWFLVTAANAESDSSSILIAVSQSEDPTASWNLYKVKADPAGESWADYPNIGFNKNWVAVTVNLFGDTSDNSDTGRIYLFNRSDLAKGLSPAMKMFNVDQGVIPAVTYDSTEDDLYFMEVYSEPAGQLQMLKATGAIGSESIINVGYPAIHMTWAPIPSNYLDFGPQLNDTAHIQCNDDRMGNVLVKNGAIWCTHTVFLPAGARPTRSSILWWSISTNADVLQTGLIDDASANNFYAFPSIAVNKYNDALIGYSLFNAQQYASAAYSLHDHSQTVGSANDPYTFIKGENTYYKSAGNRNRWGDCSATVVDPLNDVDFWTINEYAESTADNWGSWWASVSGLDSINHDPIPNSVEVLLAPNPNNGNFDMYINGAINTPLQFDIYNMIGQHIYTKSVTNAATGYIWISQLNGTLLQGLYIARIKVNGETIEKKIVVKD